MQPLSRNWRPNAIRPTAVPASGGLITVVLATYNWPAALGLCLQSLARQTDRNFEVVIADDGSGRATSQLIEAYRDVFPVPITHLWQEDRGFRKTRILNRAVAAARGAYLIFLDGDCIVQNDFVARHRSLAAPGHMVTGSRVLVGERLTAALCRSGVWDEPAFRRNALTHRYRRGISKLAALFVKLPDSRARLYRDFAWRRIKGCNMACYKANALAIGGFDEAMTGWGHEDADFVFRLHRSGIRRKSGAFSTEVLHLWHRLADRTRAPLNVELLRRRIGGQR